ncbi:FAD-binding oxidoreductase [Haloferax mediterranei ATCC 33500]|uniref:FAD-binding oxidoreductase n=1 Tax=Haloferax mediterranei (strain ATCC 33500 / DSM 1411 / JCM 8866 / NBRC 14739 / NCIMB 2177 / R-4) TaxID=523841 RepID=I3R8P7_HALMT|nr:FAD-dependent oxidoreductase [Haloferax mediterranei]AFK20607.1 sarcosine oxidase beta subunit [Haloferax mediterranei ATCC 33500]AHZ22908.1 FAD-dependent oxidoreductase [Haloferax mediterranei ATCC 33500]EMA03075.1 sarcosine oxidase beta subunit [Haloferax mediterranei ATCC 33500]MDX5987745.1 FAD-dependent oxidoreductase [Haloferax mediterranei ATCC 33500]QCQ74225.1 FAD-binding oxidoreductase [Haloferax mediterranei ATCC 33500]
MHVLIVGGGVVGLACAHALADRGAEVTVCEAGTLGGGSTGRAAGGIRTQFSTRVNVDLSLASIPVWESFADEFGVDIDYRRPGYLFLARTEETAAAFRENVAMQTEAGAPSRLLDPEEAREYLPELRAGEFVAATYSTADGIADPHSAVQGFAGAVRDAGGDIRTKTAVTGLSRRDDGWRVAVEGEDESGDEGTNGDETIDVDAVVVAAGAWSGQVAALAGIDLPIAPRRRQIAVVEPDGDLPEDAPLTIDLDTGSYFRPERAGTAIVGGHFADSDPDVDPDRFDESMDVEWALEATERADDCAAYFGPETRIRNGWAGLYAVTPDHHAIVDEVESGFVVAAGFSGHGFQHAPATGEAVADLCLGEDACEVDVSTLSLDRFESGETLQERNVA